MAFTNSPLVSYTKISPNRTKNRNHAIDTITIHCVVGQCSVETIGSVFASESRQASSNYGIGPDGRIGMYCEEKDRSWCSSNGANDHRAVTIEVASDTTPPYAVREKAYAALIDLCVDICKRNNIKKLLWKGDKSLIGQVDKQNMTVHRWFANKSCPGDYLYSRHGAIAAAVNKRLGVDSDISGAKPAAGLFRVRKTWDDTKSQIGAYKNLTYAKEKADKNAGYSVFDEKGNAVYSAVKPGTEIKPAPYQAGVSITNLNIRTGPGTDHEATGQFTGKGVFTIIEESSGEGSVKGWGKLKSGAGWISLDYCTKI